MNKRLKGDFYEQIAVDYIVSQGVEIVCRNYRCRMGEIDIIGYDGDTIVFFEVKYRKNAEYGTPFDAIDYRKQKKIVNVAKFYLNCNPVNKYVRFDAIGITGDEVQWIKDAFTIT